MRGGIIVWWALLSTSLGEEIERGRMLFGCKVHYESEGKRDCCIMMKVLSQVSMKLQVYWREKEAMTMMVFPNVSHSLSGNYSSVDEQQIEGMEYDLLTGERNHFNGLLFERLRGKLASNGYRPENLLFALDTMDLMTKGANAKNEAKFKTFQ